MDYLDDGESASETFSIFSSRMSRSKLTSKTCYTSNRRVRRMILLCYFSPTHRGKRIGTMPQLFVTLSSAAAHSMIAPFMLVKKLQMRFVFRMNACSLVRSLELNHLLDILRYPS